MNSYVVFCNSYADPFLRAVLVGWAWPYKEVLLLLSCFNYQSTSRQLQSTSTSEMARFFAALLAAVAMLSVGSAAPFPFTNGTSPAAPGANSTAITSTPVAPEVLKRRLRDFPIALVRP
ncbi:hypothetical protein F5Y04DRAFT_274798 [Hypomontagnella monticulosa]|nr:hypothetical protein F5Y04DRAFT_274798 [Hypomontagnella monticulosa]